MSRRSAAVAAVAVAMLAAGWVSASRAEPPGPPPRVFAFVSRADGREITQLARHGARISVAAPNWYALDVPSGAIRGGPDRTLTATAARVGVPLWPVVNGLTRRSGQVCAPEWQRTVAQGIRAVAAAALHPGMTLDLEELAPEQRACFTSLVRRVATALHADGRRLAVYAPRTGGAYDWAAIEEAADLLIVSGYNEHWAGSGPGPVTTSAGFERVARRAAAVDRGRVAVAIAAFGYRWPAGGRGGRGVLISSAEGERLAQTAGARVRRADGEARVDLPDGTLIWFETARGLRARIAVARDERLRWVALFTLGREPDRLWDGL